MEDKENGDRRNKRCNRFRKNLKEPCLREEVYNILHLNPYNLHLEVMKVVINLN